jgi:hypothetical protein
MILCCKKQFSILIVLIMLMITIIANGCGSSKSSSVIDKFNPEETTLTPTDETQTKPTVPDQNSSGKRSDNGSASKDSISSKDSLNPDHAAPKTKGNYPSNNEAQKGSNKDSLNAPPRTLEGKNADATADKVYETSKPPEEEGPKGPKIVKIIDILSKPDTYNNQTILVEGKIVTQCSSGCWFNLKDDAGVIYVDLAPSNLVIPQKRGATARVYGEVVNKKGDIYLIGKKVEF